MVRGIIMAFVACSGASLLAAQQPPGKVSVSAPFAQRIVLAAMKRHPEALRIGLHAVPPGGSDSIVIANYLPSLIGDRDSDKDIAAERSSKPQIERREKGGTYERVGYYKARLPLNDASGNAIGMVAVEIPFQAAASEEQALKMSVAISAEMEREIPSKSALFAP